MEKEKALTLAFEQAANADQNPVGSSLTIGIPGKLHEELHALSTLTDEGEGGGSRGKIIICGASGRQSARHGSWRRTRAISAAVAGRAAESRDDATNLVTSTAGRARVESGAAAAISDL